jgi:DNA modification methylase
VTSLTYGPNDAECGVYAGDCRELLRQMPADSVQCVVTSPPYWGLRDYGVGGQIGLESSPDDYVKAMVDVFREVWRVLRPDGTLWLNIGDSYNGSGGAGGDYGEGGLKAGQPRYPGRKVGSLKPKDLCGIPWRVALALQADGWWLRSDIIWAKGLSFCESYAGSSMPESVTDRPSKSHEYVFLLTKNARYFYDAEAVREDAVKGGDGAGHRNNNPRDPRMATAVNGRFGKRGDEPAEAGRNLRSVWTINPAGFAEAHFATFPPALVEPMIKAGTSEYGCCSAKVKKLRMRPDLTEEEQAKVMAYLRRKGLA